jgi:nitroimidazol reductase NimA-like FMN-containing flavoprotein (pyridoxamine 5'-phosphate oxidase superfamily)
MRRMDLAWNDWPAINAFLKDQLICRVALQDEPFPYVVAQSFTYRDDAFLIHCSRYGKMAGLLKDDRHLTIEVDKPVALLKAPKGQNTSLEYYSVIARCIATVIESTDGVREHQEKALEKFRPEQGYEPIEDAAANQIVAFNCKVVEMSAKKRILADGQYSPPGQPKAPYVRFPFPAGAAISSLGPDAFDPHRFK